MSGFFGGILVKLFAGGLVCAIALILAGNGAQREIVRLACAALMIVIIFTSTFQVGHLRNIARDFSLQNIENDVEKALNNALETQKEQISKELTAYIEEKAENEGIICKVEITHKEGSVYETENISISTATEVTDAQKNILMEIITGSCNAKPHIIVFK